MRTQTRRKGRNIENDSNLRQMLTQRDSNCCCGSHVGTLAEQPQFRHFLVPTSPGTCIPWYPHAHLLICKCLSNHVKQRSPKLFLHSGQGLHIPSLSQDRALPLYSPVSPPSLQRSCCLFHPQHVPPAVPGGGCDAAWTSEWAQYC